MLIKFHESTALRAPIDILSAFNAIWLVHTGGFKLLPANCWWIQHKMENKLTAQPSHHCITWLPGPVSVDYMLTLHSSCSRKTISLLLFSRPGIYTGASDCLVALVRQAGSTSAAGIVGSQTVVALLPDQRRSNIYV